MKKLLVVVLVFLIGGAVFYGYTKSKTQIIDCGLDQECFKENFRSCTPAKIGGGAIIIEGGRPESCEIFAFSPESKIDNQVFSEEMSMTCITNLSFPTTEFEAINMGGFLMMELVEKANCEGTLADIYKETLENFEDTTSTLE
jgi:hypothetical protein